jgi:ClpP class serine protease
MTPFGLLWLFFIISSLQPLFQQRLLTHQRVRALRALEKRNGSRGITLIHRREGFAFLGIPFGGFIDIDDSEAVIRAIEMTADEVPIDLILHTLGGLVLAAEQIAAALAAHPASVTVHVPHYAMSGGTLIALAADRIVMAPSAVLGPVDPQIGELPVASILAAVQQKDPNEVDDRTLILADVGRKAQHQVETLIEKLLARHLPAERAREVAQALSEGRWTHDFPIDVDLRKHSAYACQPTYPMRSGSSWGCTPATRAPAVRRVHPWPLRQPVTRGSDPPDTKSQSPNVKVSCPCR